MIILFVSLLITLLFSYFTIPLLKKLKANQELNRYLIDMHKGKSNTPTMGGILFILPVLVIFIILLISNKIDYSINLITLLFVFLSYGIIGFIDDFLIIKNKNNKGLTVNQKLILEILVAIICFYLFMLGFISAVTLAITDFFHNSSYISCHFRKDKGHFYQLLVLHF